MTDNDNLPAPVPGSVRDLLRLEKIKSRVSEVLGERAPQFIASLSNLIYQSPELKDCEPYSVIASAMVAAAMDLPIEKNLGFAYIIGYYDKKARRKVAQFQMGWKGFVQLALRTGEYTRIEANAVYKGEVKRHNRFTGDVEFGERVSDEVAGYLLYFKLRNGFEKYVYMTVDQAQKHGEKYSPTYGKEWSKWTTNPHDMGLKTVVKQGISKWGVMSIQFQNAVAKDSALEIAEAENTMIGGPSYEDPAYVAGQIDAEQVKADQEALFPKE